MKKLYPKYSINIIELKSILNSLIGMWTVVENIRQDSKPNIKKNKLSVSG